VKIKFFGTVMILVVSLLFLFSPLAFAAEPVPVTVQGKIMDWDLKKNMIVVNEKYFFWNAETLFHDEKGNVIKGDQFKPGQLKMNTLVNIEAVKAKGKRQFIIKKISLLP
jgi:hypothetical protein